MLLLVKEDELRDLGTPPAPPPLESLCSKRTRGWADDPAWEPMDPGVLVFEEGKLLASYGPDTCRARAKKRTVNTFPLKRSPPK